MEITEGRLEERACPDCDGLERRAFGEAVSARGELASYAIGWTTGAGHDAGRMTIGIGAGNPGGGTFHIEVVRDGEDWGMRIADEPFEDVPEGGPDLTRAQALEHEDLRFVWHVADHVMAQDRRAWWMESWLMGTMAYVTQPVLDRTAPVRAVVHDERRLAAGCARPSRPTRRG